MRLMTMIYSFLRNSVHYWEVSAIKHVRYRDVPLYTKVSRPCVYLFFHIWNSDFDVLKKVPLALICINSLTISRLVSRWERRRCIAIPSQIATCPQPSSKDFKRVFWYFKELNQQWQWFVHCVKGILNLVVKIPSKLLKSFNFRPMKRGLSSTFQGCYFIN